jgi:hypothetical protein
MFKYLGTNQNLVHEEIKSILNSKNNCHQSVQNLLSSLLLSENLKIRTYKTITLRVVLYGCRTWSLISREERRLMVINTRVLGSICGTKRNDIIGGWRNPRNEELHNLYSSPNII